MAKQELTPEQIAEKEAAKKAAEEKAAKEAKVECMYCGKMMKADKAVTDSNGNTFCSDEHAETYAKTMRQIHQNY